MSRFRVFFLIFQCWMLLLPGLAQEVDLNDFRLVGDAIRTGGNCIRLTEAMQWSSGSIWHRTPINLEASFEMELELMFGCDDIAGADGLVFVFLPDAQQLGYAGEGMGFAGLIPSLGIEVDTWENEHLGDPAEDHVAILANGMVNHILNLAGPVKVKNLEDCRLHQLGIRWNAGSQVLYMSIDGREVIRYRGDIIREIFRGQSRVYWGVTAATGRYFNRHEICVRKLDYLPALETRDLVFDQATARRLIDGEIMVFEKLQYESGQSDLKASSFADLDRLANLMKANPKLAVEIFGHTDNVGDDRNNLRLSERRAKAVADYLVQRGIPRERVFSRGFGEQYPLASNSSGSGRLKNRRVEIHLFMPVP